MDIQDRIQKTIEYTGLSKNAFALKIGVQPQTLHHIVSGRRTKPSFDILEKIASTLPFVNLSWLLTGKGDMIQTNVYIPASGDNVGKMSGFEQKQEINLSPEEFLDSIDFGSLNKEMMIMEKLKKANKVSELYDSVLDFIGDLDMCNHYTKHYYFGDLSNSISKYIKGEMSVNQLSDSFKNNLDIVKQLSSIITPYKATLQDLYDQLEMFNESHDRLYCLDDERSQIGDKDNQN